MRSLAAGKSAYKKLPQEMRPIVDMALRAVSGKPWYFAFQRMERAEGVPQALSKNLEAIQRTLESAGVEFLNPDNGGPGVRLKGK